MWWRKIPETRGETRFSTFSSSRYPRAAQENALCVQSVEVTSGGEAGPPTQVADGIWAVPITLDAPLTEGQTRELVHETVFDFREPPPPVLRRAAPRHPAEMEMAVTFDPARLPAAVHLSTWATVTDHEPVSSVAVALDRRHRVSAIWTAVRAGLVGFSWTWAD